MKYLLDTDHISILQQTNSALCRRLSQRLAMILMSDWCVSVVSYHEQLIGAHSVVVRAPNDNDLLRGYRLLADLHQSYAAVTMAPFDTPALLQFAKLRSFKLKIATLDLRIASIALANNLIVLTRNQQDFAGVPGLSMDDWTK